MNDLFNEFEENFEEKRKRRLDAMQTVSFSSIAIDEGALTTPNIDSEYIADDENLKMQNLNQSNDDKQQESEDFAPILSISFILRSILALGIYFLFFFVSPFRYFILRPLVTFVIKIEFIKNWIISVSKGNENTLSILQNIIASNLIYFLLFFLMTLLFFPEIIKATKGLMRQAIYLILVPINWIVAILSTTIIITIIEQFINLPDTSKNQESINEALRIAPLGEVFPIVIAAPIVEELIFRGVIAGMIYLVIYNIFKYLTKKEFVSKAIGVIISLILSSVTFGFLHVISAKDFAAVIPYIIMGATLTATYFISKRNILIVILAHAYSNLIAIISGVFLS